ILLKNSSRMSLPSTVAQPGAAGVSLEFDAEAMSAAATSSPPSEGMYFVLAGPRPCSPSIRWYSGEERILRSGFARPGSLLCAELPLFEPPAKTGAGLPSLPGSANTPKVSSFQVRTGLPSFSERSPIDQCAHAGAMMVAEFIVVSEVDLSSLVATS